jgi:hypothetical protein
MQQHVCDDPPALRDMRPDLEPQLETAVLRMLRKDSALRWPTLRDALAAVGARPLLDDDPVRDELARLATLGDAPAATSESLTPTEHRRRARQQPAAATPWTATPAPTPDERLYLIVAEPPSKINVGDRFEMTAVICREQGTIVVDKRVQWASSDPAVIKIDKKSGAARALTAGTARITASAHGMSSSAILDVTPTTKVPVANDRHGDRTRLIGGATLGVALASAMLWVLTDERPPVLEPIPAAEPTIPPRRDTQPIVTKEIEPPTVQRPDSPPAPREPEHVRRSATPPAPRTVAHVVSPTVAQKPESVVSTSAPMTVALTAGDRVVPSNRSDRSRTSG